MSANNTVEKIDLLKDDRARKAVQQEAYRSSSLFSRADEPFKHDRSKPISYCEIDTHVMHDSKHGTYMDIFGRYLSDDEVKRRRKLEAERIAEIEAKKEAGRAAVSQRQAELTAKIQASLDRKASRKKNTED